MYGLIWGLRKIVLRTEKIGYLSKKVEVVRLIFNLGGYGLIKIKEIAENPNHTTDNLG